MPSKYIKAQKYNTVDMTASYVFVGPPGLLRPLFKWNRSVLTSRQVGQIQGDQLKESVTLLGTEIRPKNVSRDA